MRRRRGSQRRKKSERKSGRKSRAEKWKRNWDIHQIGKRNRGREEKWGDNEDIHLRIRGRIMRTSIKSR